MVSSNSVLLLHIIPALGCLIAFLMNASPLKAVLQVRKKGALQDLNPLPFVAMWANAASWLVYGFLTRDLYVFMSNEPGILLGCFQTIVCYGYAETKVRDRLLLGVLFFTSLLTAAGAVISLGGLAVAQAQTVWGCVTVFILLIYYSAPLSALAEVIRTRSSASLHWPLSFMNTVNGCLWTAYGLALGDAFIYAPNVVGATLGLVQLGLIAALPRKERAGGYCDLDDSQPMMVQGGSSPELEAPRHQLAQQELQ